MLTSQVEVYVEIQSVALFIKRGENLFEDNEAKQLKNMHAEIMVHRLNSQSMRSNRAQIGLGVAMQKILSTKC
jgi:hypothetical protein